MSTTLSDFEQQKGDDNHEDMYDTIVDLGICEKDIGWIGRKDSILTKGKSTQINSIEGNST